MEGKILFEKKAMKDDNTGGLAMAGIVIFLVLAICSAASGGMIGPWYYYAAGLALCIALVVNATKKHATVVKLTAGKGDEIFISISGKANNASFPVEEYSYWYVITMRSAKMGGKEVKLHFKASGINGEELRFTQALFPSVEPRSWQQHTAEFKLNETTFMVPDLTGLAKAIDGHVTRTR